jgi:universal stress protein E
MREIRRILVPVRHYEARALPVLAKAAQLARAFGAQIELFHDIATPVLNEALGTPGYTLGSIKRAARDAALAGLERLAAPWRQRGVAVETCTVWDYPPAEAIVRRALATATDLIVVARHERHRLPALLGLTDWELLRQSPVPVLLVKREEPYRRPRVLAALDPEHAFAKTSGLDQRILEAAAALSGALRGSLAALHAYQPLPLPPPPGVLLDNRIPERMRKAAERVARSSFEHALEGTAVRGTRRHVVEGSPAVVIPSTARKLRSAIVVMGAVSRSGLKRLFIGNTAEKVMDALSCDLLVVKPPHFASRVPRARRGVLFATLAPVS